MSIPALELRQLTKRYRKDVIALDSIDLTVQQGDFFGVLGPNGAGKTTAIGIICSLVTKTTGRVRVLGHDLDTDPIAVKREIGLVPQEFNIDAFQASLYALIHHAGLYGIGRREARVRAEYYLKYVDLWEQRNVPAQHLSGGMKRRFMIARALLHHPKLLILDEPTAGVDVELRYLLWELLEKLNESGVTIILTSHYLEEIERLCKRVAIINAGKVVRSTEVRILLSELDTEFFMLELVAPREQAPVLGDFKLTQKDANTLSVEVGRNQSLNTLFSHLNEQNIQVKSLRNASNRLEKLFIELTGHA